MVRVAVLASFAAMLVRLAPWWTADEGGYVLLWNVEQMTWWLSLVAFALAFGEAGEDLFDRIFVRLQTAFILLAGVMMLVITQTGLRDRWRPTCSRTSSPIRGLATSGSCRI